MGLSMFRSFPALIVFNLRNPGAGRFIDLQFYYRYVSISYWHFGATNSITFGRSFYHALLLHRRTDGSECRQGMRSNLSLKRKRSTDMSGNRQPKTCHLIILQFGLMIHVVPAMMFRCYLSRLKQGSSIPRFLQTTAEFGGRKKQYRE